MNFLKKNKNYVLIALTSLFVIYSTLIFIEILNNGETLLLNIKQIFNNFVDLLGPFILGFSIAFILNSPSKKLNQFFIKYNIFSKNICKFLSLFITYIIFFGSFTLIVRLIIPAILLNIYQLGVDLYEYIIYIQENLQKTVNSNNDNDFIIQVITFLNKYTNNMFDVNTIFTSIVRPIINWVSNIPELISQLLTSLVSIISIVFDSILAIMISFYFLMDRELFIKFGYKTTYALFKKNTGERIIYVASVTNSIFQKFLIGKALDSLIIGFLFFIITTLLNIPYALLFSLIIGITNMIPYFGPFIGAVPVVGLLVIIDIKLALIALVIILILQQFDGVYLGPKILGESTGVRPIGIIFAVSIGGSLFGAIGMLLGVPIFATLSFFFNEYIDNKNNMKEIESDEQEYYNTGFNS